MKLLHSTDRDSAEADVARTSRQSSARRMRGVISPHLLGSVMGHPGGGGRSRWTSRLSRSGSPRSGGSGRRGRMTT